MPASSPALTEAQWQRQVEQLASLHGWRWFHDQDSRRNRAGLPDLILVRRGRLVFAELKTQTGATRPEQDEWLTDLHAVPGLEVHVWRPSDLPLVMDTLR